jgi:hypothetical protein
MAQRVQVLAKQGHLTGEPGLLRFAFFIETGSSAQPIVTMADNNALPLLCTVYAHEQDYPGHGHGIKVDILAYWPSNALYVISDIRGIAVNIDQPGMKGPYTVHPWA